MLALAAGKIHVTLMQQKLNRMPEIGLLLDAQLVAICLHRNLLQPACRAPTVTANQHLACLQEMAHWQLNLYKCIGKLWTRMWGPVQSW